jgi:nucleoside-diphosphate-sugar epimerase
MENQTRFVTHCKPLDYIRPAVQGTVGILTSAVKNACVFSVVIVKSFVEKGSRPNVKRIVITSSSGAVTTPPSKTTVFSEKDWNQESLDDVEKNGINATTMSKYRTSKLLAERGQFRPVITQFVDLMCER